MVDGKERYKETNQGRRKGVDIVWRRGTRLGIIGNEIEKNYRVGFETL